MALSPRPEVNLKGNGRKREISILYSNSPLPNLGQIYSSASSPLKSTAVPTRPGSFMESLSKAQGLGSPSFLGRSGHMDSPAGCTSPGGPNQAGAELAAKPGFSYANAVRGCPSSGHGGVEEILQRRGPVYLRKESEVWTDSIQNIAG